MYSVGALELLGFFLFVWLGCLTFLVLRERSFLRKLFPQDELGDIRTRFEEIMKVIEEADRREQVVNKNIRDLSRSSLTNIQKVALLRYNPYEDTGGNVSFSLALLNGRGNGVVLTSLHTRSGTRVYAKSVIEGKSKLQLSDEEQDVINKALNE